MYTCSLPCWTWIGVLADGESTQTALTQTRLRAEPRPLIQKRLPVHKATFVLACY